MKVALVGYGVENQSVYRYFEKKGVRPVICDQNENIELPDGAEAQLGEGYLNNLERFDVIVRSVGIHPSVITSAYPEGESRITTAVNLFFDECKTPIIGVTGTKGKGTTSTLIHKIMEAAGKKTLLAGNIGVPMLDLLPEVNSQDYIILELSSFQLHDLKRSPHVAVCLMVVPEHLNWHADMDDYKRSKGNLFRYQNSDDVAIYNALNQSSIDIASASPTTVKLTYAVPAEGESAPAVYTVRVEGDTIYNRHQEIMKINEVALLGRHNLENVCAAIAATWDFIGGNIDAIKFVVSSFTGLEFRLQLIRELNGVKYYNDSFSTTPETAIAAINSFNEPKVVILGGSDKGIPFDELAKTLAKSDIRQVILMGNATNTKDKTISPKIEETLRFHGVTSITALIKDGGPTMEEIVKAARDAAQPGDVVLLSAGCASFDMFKDYKDRGKQFNQAVLSLS